MDRNENQAITIQLSQNQPDPTKKKESNDDSLENTNPTDSRADEKVIVNEQTSNKTVNAPSQTAVNTSEGISTDEEIIN